MTVSSSVARSAALAVVGLTMALSVSALADTLVTRSGAQIETRGAWQVKGKLLVFTRADGSLSSLRVSEVDLDKSASATTAAKAPPAPVVTEKPAKRVVLRLTDNDVGHSEAEAATAAAQNPAATNPEAAAAPKANALVVQGWDQHPAENGDGISITGTVQNPTKNTATDITIDVGLYGVDGKLLQISRAELASASLPPGQKTTFRCNFPGVMAMSAAKFDIRSTNLVNTPEATGEGSPPSDGGSANR